ncbi:oxidoreductase [Deinococcus irradiatisoli]|uniref:Oxidoreductase n=1 Tax=Deinococcus irradiatisoli TaxID=2202254 RepID=A0A2Z3JH88_9DEIO|nr:MDR family oxidoreductase [Deinococcus irradiatisoli]AWN23396.1 oxidoreductase [Deinococcus irradiatisoli]
MTSPALPDTFRALLLTKEEGQAVHAEVTTLPVGDLPEGEVTVRVQASDLNYKDGLAVTGKLGIRTYPMVPGIDFAGTVLDSRDERYAVGDAVTLTGWGVGERHWGGYSELARVKADWLVRTPARFGAAEAMAVGTAGLTAMLCVMALEDAGLKPEAGDVLVTGAAGGVGSVAVSLLAARGYRVVTSTGRVEEEGGFLRGLGAAELLHRDELSALKKPLEKERWAAAVDVVGGETLAGVLASTKYGGHVAACGLAGGMQLPATVMPFILRGVTLHGVDSVQCPADKRQRAWDRLAAELPQALLDHGVQTAQLEDLPRLAGEILAGQVRGRTVITLE